MLTPNRYDLRVSYDGQVKVNIPQFVTCICRLEIEVSEIGLPGRFIALALYPSAIPL